MLTWFNDILNMLFTFLDRIVYGLISILYELFLYLANLDLFGMSTLTDPAAATDNVIIMFGNRVYALLGIFMLFKVSFSILQYMVNPDDFSDKAKGFGKMITNILISLVLVVAVPFIFQFAFEVQKVVLSENLLGQLILGKNTTSSQSTDEEIKDDMNVNVEMAQDLQFLVYGSFFSVDTEVVTECENTPILGTKDMAGNKECLEYLSSAFEGIDNGTNLLADFFPGVTNTGRNFDAFGDVVNVKRDGEYIFNYMPIISTIAGGFVAIMLLTFCMDAAVRIIKLGFLEIISPIPIISYMDPKQSGKDGMLGRWAKECFSTFLSLFIRIAIIYFAFFVVDIVANNILADPNDQLYLYGPQPEGLMAVFVQVMVILGVLFFAKEVPKLLENLIPGMSGVGNLTINPLKKISESPLAAGAVGLGIGAGVGSLTSAAAAFAASRDEGAGMGQAIRRGIGGGASGMFRGAKAGALAGGKGIVSKSADVAGRVGRNAALKTNTTLRQRAGAYARQAVGMQSKKEALDKQIGYHESIQKHASNMKDRAASELAKKHDGYKMAEMRKDQIQQQYNERGDIHTGNFKTFINEKGILERQEEVLKYGTDEYEQYFSKQMNDLNDEQKGYVEEYVNSNGKIIDGSEDYHITVEKDALSKEIEENQLHYEDENGKEISTENLKDADWSTIKSVGDAAEREAITTKNSEEYRDAATLDKNIHSENRQSLFTRHK